MSHSMTLILASTAAAASLCASVYGAPAVSYAGLSLDEALNSLGADTPVGDAAEPAAPAPAAADVMDLDALLDGTPAAAPAAEPEVAVAAPVAEPEAAPAAPAAEPTTDLLADLLPAAESAPVAEPEVAVAAPVAEPEVAVAAPVAEPEVAVAEPEAAPAAPADDLADILPAPAPAAELPVAEAEAAPIAEEAPAEVAEAAPTVAPLDADTALADVLPPAPPAPAEPVYSEEEKLIDEMANLAGVRIRAQNEHALGEYAAGMEDLRKGVFERAIRHFLQARQFVSPTSVDGHGQRYADLIDNNMAEAYYRQALVLERIRNYEEARKNAVQANQLGHPKAPEMVVRLNDLIANPPPMPEPPKTVRSREPDYLKGQKFIREKLERAREFYGTGEYDKAREQIEMVLHDHPFNHEAITLLRRLENRRYDFVNNEFEATRETMIRQVKEIWTPRTYAPESASVGEFGSGNTVTNVTLDSVAIERKLRSIVIPEINFRQANLTDVITFLSDASRENDAENTSAERKGINFILQTSNSTQPVSDMGTDDIFGGGAAVDASAGGSPTFTFSAHYVPLKDVLDIVMNTGNLKYRIRSNMVVIMDKNAPDGDLQFRTYSVLPDIETKVVSMNEPENNSNDIMGIGSASIQGGTSDWKEFFRKFGVDWPDGSSVEYMRPVGRLIVKNTVENLSNLETVLAILNVTPKQIEIEARFVEVAQTDLDSLGIEWNLNNNWEMLEHKGDANLPIDQRRRIEMKKGSLTSGFGYLSDNTNPDVNGGSSIADNILTVGSVLTNPELTLVLHMLSSRQNTDLLSAPKVVTKNGQEATIKVVTEYIYPTEYEVEMLEVEDDDGNQFPMGAVVEPNNFQTREVGVQLTVMPSVTEDGQLIDLTLAPQVVTEPTWKNYGSSYPMRLPDGTYGNSYLNMEQPFFPVRSITTSIQIFNGATVVMGGMITENRVSREDKIPFLGDLPFLGHLFRNKYESTEKRNLLIFVSARLVDPAGRFVRDQKDIPLMSETSPGN